MQSNHSSFIQNFSESANKSYIIAVLILALLATGAFITLQVAFKNFESTALVVNISGKQRMLSQRIALHTHQCLFHKQNNNHEARKEVSSRLLKDIETMREANIRLSSGHLSENQYAPLSAELSNMYFGEMNIFHRVQHYTQTAQQIIETTDLEQRLKFIDEINQLYDPLLVDLNKVVLKYQKESEEHLKLLTQLEVFIYLFTILTLLLEYLLIFHPLTRRVLESMQLEKNFRQQLQDQVELRTLKLEKTNRALEKVASHDPLTGVKNRLTLEQDLEELFNHYQENHQDYAIIVTDLDWFKRINDELGHDYGDYVLKTFAEILKNHLRQGDEVYRIGGEEFVLLIKRIEFEKLLSKIEALKTLITEYPFSLHGKTTTITASFGVYHSSLFAVESFKAAFKSADLALYKAKSLGRNRIYSACQTLETAESNVPVKKINLVYSDEKLENLITAEFDDDPVINELQSLFNSGNHQLYNIVYEKDHDMLKDLIRELGEELQTLKTLRMIDCHQNIIIVRLDVLKTNTEIRILIHKAVDLAQSVRDDVLVRNFHAMMDNSNDYIYFKDRNHVFTGASQTLVDVTNVNHREELIGKTDYEVFSRDIADEYFLLEKEVFHGNVKVSQKYQMTRDNSGNIGWVDNRKYPIHNASGEIIGLFGVARVISDEEYQRQMGEKIAT